MRVWNGIEDYPGDRPPAVASIGNYDGVHRGHQAILQDVIAQARRRQLPSLLITFEPHPVAVVAPDRRPRLVMTRRRKLDTLEALGLDGLLILRFDAELAALPGERFLGEYLLPRVPLAALRVGENFRFGRGRHGDLALLERCGAEAGVDVRGVPAVRDGDETVSSSAIRAALAEGRVERAARLLGRPYALEGRVVRGEGRGRTLRFPTANLELEGDCLLPHGVYVTEATVLTRRYASVTNIGRRPTFDGRGRTVEAHLIDFDREIYGERLELDFRAHLRPEQRFEGPAQLADQIARDRAAALSFFQNLEPQPS